MEARPANWPSGRKGFDSELIDCLPALRRYAFSLTGDENARDELVNDVVVLSLQKHHLWREGSNLRAWLFTLMHNLHAGQCRRRNRRAVLDQIENLNLRHSQPAAQPAAMALEQVRCLMQDMPAAQRRAFLLVTVQGLSYAEAADALHVPVGTVRSRLARVRTSLRDHFA